MNLESTSAIRSRSNFDQNSIEIGWNHDRQCRSHCRRDSVKFQSQWVRQNWGQNWVKSWLLVLRQLLLRFCQILTAMNPIKLRAKSSMIANSNKSDFGQTTVRFRSDRGQNSVNWHDDKQKHCDSYCSFYVFTHSHINTHSSGYEIRLYIYM